MKFRWSIAPSQPLFTAKIAVEQKASPLLAQCLWNRGISEPEQVDRFLGPRLKNLADPFLIPNMQIAVERLLLAREKNQSIVIFGDYDVDGVSSTALLTEFLRALGWRIDFYLPNRFDEGYGLSQDAVENCLKKFKPELFLAVDCGSTAVATIGWLSERQIDVIVLDHHQVSDPAPNAVALVNPQLGANYRELCSVGLAFKLAHAVLKRARELGLPGTAEYDLRPMLDFVALGTIADIVPLNGENRILVTCGLERLNCTERPGLIALKSVAQIENALGPREVGFQLAPRLNAAGRLETAEDALNLLLARDLAEAEPIAQRLDSCNRERQKIERGITEEVIGAIKARFNPETDFFLIEGQLLWHIGVVGIVASRVMHEFYRPAIILGGEGAEWRGSGRSIEGFDLAAALRKCDDLLLRHGGHAMAAGLSIDSEKVDALRCRLNEIARTTLTAEQLKPVLRIDAEISLSDLNLERVEELERLEPHGPANPSVQLVARKVSHQRPPQRMGKENQHAKFHVTDGKQTFEAVWWNCGKDASFPKVMFDLAFAPQINEYNGNRRVQLKVLDWHAIE
ncbi:MAG: recJ [Verrucomicrobiales bacterium]|nr:recJ [Verrucomicrobiales bacterium]